MKTKELSLSYELIAESRVKSVSQLNVRYFVYFLGMSLPPKSICQSDNKAYRAMRVPSIIILID